MNQIGTSGLGANLGISLLCVSLCGCFQNLPYHRIQASRISAANARMGSGGMVAVLVNTNEGTRVEVELSFRDRQISNEQLENLRGLDGIVGIDLSGTAISDEGLDVIATLPELKYLQLADTKVTANGIKALAKSSSLERLDIRRTSVGVSAVDDLARMPALIEIFAKGTGLRLIDGVYVDTQNDLATYWGR
jgi:Leucine Rich repeat